ncbi:reverse transcriptase [Caerostris extrusa]|uniref:Reverse transcriptase n=1 Tax=Caerostris extrusa TaxID=172846 RepID=A0AAV4R099_CAEEX|nr:reverse transcriptase [Caerostris extrusa]
MVYISEEDLKNYDNLKVVVLKEFQTTPQDCLNHFCKAVKPDSESYVQSLSAIFDYSCPLRGVSPFKLLLDLIVSDRRFISLDRELTNHKGTKQGESYFKHQGLNRECNIFFVH